MAAALTYRGSLCVSVCVCVRARARAWSAEGTRPSTCGIRVTTAPCPYTSARSRGYVLIPINDRFFARPLLLGQPSSFSFGGGGVREHARGTQRSCKLCRRRGPLLSSPLVSSHLSSPSLRTIDRSIEWNDRDGIADHCAQPFTALGGISDGGSIFALRCAHRRKNARP